MKIWEIVKDIFDDMDHHSESYRDFAESAHIGRPWERRSDSLMIGGLRTLLPNIAGFIAGLALTRAMEFTGIWYFIFGVIGAVGIGVLESTVFGGISLKYAVIRHCIIVAGLCVIALLVMLSGFLQ